MKRKESTSENVTPKRFTRRARESGNLDTSIDMNQSPLVDSSQSIDHTQDNRKSKSYNQSEASVKQNADEFPSLQNQVSGQFDFNEPVSYQIDSEFELIDPNINDSNIENAPESILDNATNHTEDVRTNQEKESITENDETLDDILKTFIHQDIPEPRGIKRGLYRTPLPSSAYPYIMPNANWPKELSLPLPKLPTQSLSSGVTGEYPNTETSSTKKEHK